MSLQSHQLLVDARELREQFRRRRDDRMFEHEGGILLYAMDNDVITTVTKPWDVDYRPYLRYFLSADKEAQESLAYILAEYFLRCDPLQKAPFLLIHPTDVELERLWNNVYAGAIRQRNSIDAALGEIREHLNKRDSEQPANTQEFIAFVREILEILNLRRGEIAELQRIVRVQDSENIVPAHRFTFRGVPILPEATGEGERELTTIIKEWLLALDAARPPVYPASRPLWELAQPKLSPGSKWTNNQIDAAVMGRVEWINRQFAADAAVDPANNPPKRLCFITGDVNIERIARKRSFGDQKISRLYVRNPMCFLASRTFFRAAGVETPTFFTRENNKSGAVEVDLSNDLDGKFGGTSLYDWLNLLFPEDREEPEGLLEDPKIGHEIGVASAEWSRYLKIAAVSAGLRVANEEFQRDVDALVAERDLFDRLHDLGTEVTRIGNDTVTRFGVAGVLAGFWSVDSTDHWPNRSIPAVKFDSFPVADKVIKQLWNANSLDAAKQAVSRDNIEKLRREEPTKYTVFVIFSLAFAIAGEWKSAYTVARAAFSLASHPGNGAARPGTTAKGDEAAYLCAVFCRLSAALPLDLRQGRQWLDAAEERQKMAPWRASLDGARNYRDPRFLAERLHNSLAKLHFAHFMATDQPVRERLVKGEAQSLHDLALANWAILGELDREKDEYVREAVTIQAVVNFLQIEILAKWTQDPDAILPDKAAEGVRILEGLGRQRSRGFARHVMFVYLCASALFLPSAAGWDDASRRKTLLARVKELRKYTSKRHVMPYDRERAKVMSTLIQRALEPAIPA